MSRIEIIDGAGHLPADQARSMVILVDALRAFATTSLLLAHNAREIVCAAGVQDSAEAVTMCATEPIVVGEGPSSLGRAELPNSPSMIDAKVRRRSIVLYTVNGTRALGSVPPLATVLCASAVNLSPTARWCLARNTDAPIRIVVTDPNGPEDAACAEALRAALREQEVDAAAVRRGVFAGVHAHELRWRRHVHPDVWNLFLRDAELCAQVDAAPYVCLAEVVDGRRIIRGAS